MKRIDTQKVETVFNDALELPADRRASFLSGACGDDEELRQEVESLLTSHDENFLEENVGTRVLELIRGGFLPGDVISGRYEIIEMIGSGGMGEVYLAQDATMKRRVALKVLAEEFSQDKKRVKSFENEARMASQLNHPNILTVHDFVDVDNKSFIITEFIEGETLRRKLQPGPLDLSTALKITRQIASALEAAHARGVVHRDIKPENVIVKEDGHAKVLDFGIAKLAERATPDDELNPTGMSQAEGASGFGTANYMSCEQVRAQDVDARTDIWSLGVCLYEMLTGVPPFKGDTRIDTFASILKDDPPAPPGHLVPAGLKAIVNKALQKNREDRYQTMREFLSDLDNYFRASDSGMDTFEEWRKNAGKKIWRTLLLGASLSLVVSAASAFVIYYLNLYKDLPDFVKTSAQVAQAVGSASHLILIIVAFVYFYMNPGLKGFRPVENDIEDDRLKTNITYSTGYENVRDWKQARKIAEAALKDYREPFVGLFIAWVFLYLVAVLDLCFKGNLIITSVFTQMNNFNTLCIWLCFRILNEPITTENKTQNNKDVTVAEGLKGQTGLNLVAFGTMFAWLILELTLAGSFIRQAEHIHQFSKLISGIFGGVTMALFVGRFQSKFLKSPEHLTVILFLYTVIQALFVFYGDQSVKGEAWAAAVIHAALFLKCLLILYMFWLFQSGRLLFYLVRVRRATTQVDSEWQNFREILQQES